MSVVRWTLTEKGTATSWVMPLNPNTMSALPKNRSLTSVSSPKQDRPRTFQGRMPATEFTWGGVILTQSHYDNLVLWSQKPGVIVVTDHLGRSFEVIISKFLPEQEPRHLPSDWKQKYEISALFLRRLT